MLCMLCMSVINRPSALPRVRLDVWYSDLQWSGGLYRPPHVDVANICILPEKLLITVRKRNWLIGTAVDDDCRKLSTLYVHTTTEVQSFAGTGELNTRRPAYSSMWFSNSLTAQTQLEIFDCTIHRRVLGRPTQFHSLAARRPVRRPVCVVAYCILLLRRQPRQQVLLFYARHSVDPTIRSNTIDFACTVVHLSNLRTSF